MEWERVDLRVPTSELEATWAETRRSEELCFRINTTMPYTEEYMQLVRELFKGQIGEGSMVRQGVHILTGAEIACRLCITLSVCRGAASSLRMMSALQPTHRF